MINRDCKACPFSAYCATLGADLIFARLRVCRQCGGLSYLEPPDENNIIRRRSIRVSCYRIVKAWMLAGDTERLMCSECGEVLSWKIRTNAVPDAIAECKEMKGFKLDERMPVVPVEHDVPAVGKGRVL